MKIIRSLAVFMLLLSLSTPLPADVSGTWQFLDEDRYEYDYGLIGVNTNPPGRAELLLQADEEHHATFSEYAATNTTRANVQMGFPVAVTLTKDPIFPELYNPVGIFKSRVIQSDGATDYVVARISNIDHTGDPTLVSFIPMNSDGWRDAVTDQVGYPSGAVGFTADAKEGTHAGDFSGGSVSLPGAGLNGATSYTLALWTKPRSHTTYGGLLCYIRLSGDLVYIDQGGTPGAVRAVMVINGQVSILNSIPTPFDTWTFIAATWDANGDGRIRAYVNGQLYGVAAGSVTSPLVQDVPISLGVNPSGGQKMKGLLDGVTIWNRALSATEVADLYDSYRQVLPYRFQFRSSATYDAITNKTFSGPRGTTNDYYYGTRFGLESAGDFDVAHPYLQYRVELLASQNRVKAPLLEAVGIYWEGEGAIDQYHLDFLGEGSGFVQDATNTEVQADATWSYLGLSKQKNGGYYTNGVYHSRVFGSPGEVVTWDRLSWSEGAEEISRSGSIGLVGLYHCRSSWADDSGSGHSGTPEPTVEYTNLGKLGGRSAVFNGVDAYVSSFSYGELPVRSMEFWLKNSNVDDAIMQLTTNSAIVIRGRMITALGLEDVSPAIYVNTRPVAGPLLQGWNHVALVWPDDVQVSALTVGKVDTGGTDYMQGQFDELAIYSRALERTEIVEHFTVGRKEVAGAVRFQVRSSNDPTFEDVPFVGPQGTESGYFYLAGAIPTPPADYCQYAAYLDGAGDGTPALTSVTIGYDLLSQSDTDESVDDFEKGVFVGGKVRPFGQKIDLVDQGFLGPANLSRLDFPALVGLWHMDEEVWGDVVDEMGAGTGSAEGGAKTSGDTLIGVRCGEFDGIDDRVVLGNPPFAVTLFSVSLWFRSTTDQRKALISSYIEGGAYFAVELNGDGFTNATGHVCMAIDDAFFGPVAAVSRRAGLNDGQWHNVIGMRNGRQLLIYVDGTLEGTAQLDAFYGDANGATPEVAHDSRLGYYEGNIDEVALFTTALTRKKISHMCGAGARTLDTGEFSGPTVAAPDATIWDLLDWGVHTTIGTPLTDEDETLVGLWHLDEVSGAVTVEDVIDGHDGSLIGISGIAGKFGNAIQLSGGNTRVLVSDSTDLEPQSLTVEAWASPNDPSAMAIVDKRTGSTGYALAMNSEGRPYFWVGDGAAGVAAVSPVGLRVGEWSHVAGSYDGTMVRLYVDGMPRAEAALSIADAETMGGDLLFGMSYQGSDHFVGKLDEVAIHERALTPVEIEDHYAAGATSIRFQARSWDPPPLGEYVGPGGTNTTYFTEWYGSVLKGSMALGQYLQYRALMNTEDYRFSPAMHGIHVAYSSYPLGKPPINPTISAAFPFLANLTAFSDSKSALEGTDVRYQISGDTGLTNRWFYWDTFGEVPQWADATDLSPAYMYSSSAQEINAYIDRFYFQWYNGVGGNFRFRALLHSSGDQPTELHNVTVTASEGRLVITAPNGLERGDDAWLVGTAYEITWTHAGNAAGTVRLDYSLDGGTNWTVIAEGVSATDDNLPWITTGRASDNALVRILHEQDPTIYDYSDGPFELIKRYQVIVPNGGEKWYIGETNDIVWGASFGLGDVSIDYSGNGLWDAPVKIGDFIKSVPGVTTNRYSWEIQTNEPDLPSTNGLIRLQTFGGSGTDYSDAEFTIAGASFTFPVAGSIVNRGAAYNITWNSAECGSNLLFEAQTVEDGPWEVVDNAVSNFHGTNSYVWSITNQPSEIARVRLTSTSDPRARGISDFFVIAALVVQSPNGDFDPLKSERWLMESTQLVTWISAGVNDEVNIRFSADGGGTWILLAEDVPNSNDPGYTNEYQLTIPPIPSNLARMRVEDGVRTNELWDMSDFDFQVAGVSIVWPNGPETQKWLYDQVGTIRWLENAVGTDAIVEFSYDGGVNWENIRGPGGGAVNLGDGESPPYWPHTPSVRGFVRITPTDPSPFSDVFDTSDFFFTVAGVKYEAPLEGDQYKIGDTTPITWVAAGTEDLDDALDIYYSGDGETFDLSDEGAIRVGEIFSEEYPGRQSFFWTVERTREPSTKARIMIKAGDFESISDTFTVKGIRFNIPAPGSVVVPGAIEIEWAQAGFTFDAEGDIYLSTEGEVVGQFTNKLTSTPIQVQLGEVGWTVPVGIEPTTNAVLQFVVTASPSLPEDVGFTAYSEPFTLQGLSLKEPALDDSLSLGATETVRWRAAAGGEMLDIFYSSDGGTNYDAVPVAQVVPSADGYNEYQWNVEMWRMPSTDARIKIVSSMGIEAESARFVMEGIKVLRPKSTDVYSITDATNRIDWVAIGDTGPYVLEYFTNGVGPFPITTVSGGTEWNWSIPVGAVSTGTQVRVSGSVYTNISESFIVVDVPTVIFRAPLEGTFWPVGGTYMVEWSRGGEMANDFKLDVSIKPYSVTTEVANGIMEYDPDENVFRAPYSVPDQLTQARFIVTHNTATGVGDVSGEFNMVGTFEVRLPNGGETLYALKPVPVIWRTIGSVPAVDVYYSITPPYKADTWIKANDTPIPNNTKPDFESEQTSWPWPVENIRSSLAKVRVQEAQYPQLFDSGESGPYDDSDGPFNISYYMVRWIVMDARDSEPLDNLSVVDSSGWSASGLSCKDGNTIVQEYPWGTWNTAWYRAFYSDEVVINWRSENLELGAPPVWTQQVFMTPSEIEPDYNVMANFAYKPDASTFLVSSWMERGGLILDQPSVSRIYVYEEQGDLLADMPVVNSSPGGNGVFWTTLDASVMDRGAVYFARVEIEYSGKTYSSGVTFEISVSSGEDIVAEITKELSNVESNLTGEVRDVGSAVAQFREEAMGKLTNISDKVDIIATNTAAITNLFGDSMVDLTNQISLIGTLTNVEATVERLESSSLAKILTQPDVMVQGSTNTILYKTRSTYAEDAVTLRAYRSGSGTPLVTRTMQRIVGGIYQETLILSPSSWPLGDYYIECTDPGASDRVGFRVVPFDVHSIGEMSELVAGMRNVEVSVSNLNESVGGLTNLQMVSSNIIEMASKFDALSTNVVILSEVTVGLESNITRLVDNIGDLDLRILSTNVQELAVNVSNMVSQIGGVDLIQMESNVTETLDLVNGLQDLGAITNVLVKFQEAVGTNLAAISESLDGVDFQDMYTHVTNIEAVVGGGGPGGDLSNLVAKIEAVATNVSEIAAQFAGVSLGDMYSAVSNTETIVRGLGDMDQIGRDVSNAVDKLTSMTNLSTVAESIDALRDDLKGVSFSEMATGVSNIFDEVQGVAATLGGIEPAVLSLSNSVDRLDALDVAGMAEEVSNISSNLEILISSPGLAQDLTNLAEVVQNLDYLEAVHSNVTDIVAELRMIEGLPEVSTNVALMKAKLDGWEWPTNFSDVVADLGTVNFDQMGAQLTSVTNMLKALDVDKLSESIGDLTNSLAGADLAEMSATLTNVQSIVSGLGDVSGLSSNVTLLAEQMGAIEGLAAVDFSALPRIEQSLGTAAIGEMLATLEGGVNGLNSGISDLNGQLDGIETGVAGASANAAQATSQATKASKNSASAKTAASDASTAIGQLKSELEKGNMEGAMAILQRLKASLAAAHESLEAIPKGELVTDVYSSMVQMAGQMETFAASRGYDWLTKMKDVPEALGGAEGAAAVADADETMINTLNENMQEMRVSMGFMQELLDEMRYEPVVDESLIGVGE